MQARQALGLTARALAALCGWHESKCSRIEHGHTPPSDADLRAWTLHCGAQDQTADLIAAARGIDGMYVEWRRLERAGLKPAQESVTPLFDRTRRFLRPGGEGGWAGAPRHHPAPAPPHRSVACHSQPAALTSRS